MSNDPNAIPPVCPKCGGTSEDFAGLGKGDPTVLGFDWECPCGALLSDDELVSVKQFASDKRYDRRVEEGTE